MSKKIKNGRLGLHDAEYSNCNRLMTLDFKGLTPSTTRASKRASSDTTTVVKAARPFAIK